MATDDFVSDAGRFLTGAARAETLNWFDPQYVYVSVEAMNWSRHKTAADWEGELRKQHLTSRVFETGTTIRIYDPQTKSWRTTGTVAGSAPIAGDNAVGLFNDLGDLRPWALLGPAYQVDTRPAPYWYNTDRRRDLAYRMYARIDTATNEQTWFLVRLLDPETQEPWNPFRHDPVSSALWEALSLVTHGFLPTLDQVAQLQTKPSTWPAEWGWNWSQYEKTNPTVGPMMRDLRTTLFKYTEEALRRFRTAHQTTERGLRAMQKALA